MVWRQSECTHVVTGHKPPSTHTGSQGLAHSVHRDSAWWRSPDQHDAVRGQEALSGLAAASMGRGKHSALSAVTQLWPAAERETCSVRLLLWERVCVSRSEGMPEQTQLPNAWTVSALSGSWRNRHSLHSFIKLSMPETQSSFLRKWIKCDS